jgi:hypothetical protein
MLIGSAAIFSLRPKKNADSTASSATVVDSQCQKSPATFAWDADVSLTSTTSNQWISVIHALRRLLVMMKMLSKKFLNIVEGMAIC